MAQKTSVADNGSLVDFFSGIGRKLFQGASHFWNINKDVGWGYDNKKSDVLLIQYLINSTNTAAKLVEDGIFGKKTYQAIKAFQTKYDSLGIGSLYADGVINIPAGFGTPGGVYTIHALNSVYLQNNRSFYNDLRMDPKLPSHLCQILLM
jgi:peptidoglycan hydrolase-like protein with peptidoglycan-binding domain